MTYASSNAYAAYMHLTDAPNFCGLWENVKEKGKGCNPYNESVGGC